MADRRDPARAGELEEPAFCVACTSPPISTSFSKNNRLMYGF